MSCGFIGSKWLIIESTSKLSANSESPTGSLKMFHHRYWVITFINKLLIS